MPDDLLQRVLELAGKQDKAELTVLHNAVVTSLREYDSDPTKGNLADWRAAKEAYEAKLADLAAKYGLAAGGSGAGGAEKSFANLKQVHAWLVAQGWRISKSGIYKHKNEGKITPDLPGGKFSARRVRKYAKDWLKRADTGKRPQAELEEAMRRKAISDARRSEAAARKLEMEIAVLEGKYIPRDDFYAELTARALALESGLKAMVQSRVLSWIDMVGGDETKAAELAAAVSDDIDRLMGEFATLDKFVVIADFLSGFRDDAVKKEAA